MKPIPTILGSLGFLAACLSPSLSAEKSIIVFDTSGSMWAHIDGKARIEIARETFDYGFGEEFQTMLTAGAS